MLASIIYGFSIKRISVARDEENRAKPKLPAYKGSLGCAEILNIAQIGKLSESPTVEASCSCGKFRMREIHQIWPYQGLLGAKSMRDKSTAEASC